MSLAFDLLAPHVTGVVLALAWVGALGWPVAAGGAAIAFPSVRRSWIAWLLAGLVTVGWLLGAWAFLIEPKLLFVRAVDVESAAWRGPPLRVAVVSDVHVGPHMNPKRVARLVARVNAERADLVVLAGDFVSGHVPREARWAGENAEIERGLAALGGLAAPLGTIAVLGNHDWWYDADLVAAALEAEGAAVLENAAVHIDRTDGSDFWLAGLADYESETAQPDWNRALAEIPEGADTLGLAHWPDVFWEAPERVALTVAGHSHCGQVWLPFLGRVAVSPGSALWPCGLYEESGRQLYVTGGVGVSVLPVRFRAPPEVAVVTIRAAE